jgi:hypothetical protein
MDVKTLATILFRVSGVSYLVYAVIYVPYMFMYTFYGSTLLMSVLSVLTYLAVGTLLLALSKPLGALVSKGLETKVVAPPPPPSF